MSIAFKIAKKIIGLLFAMLVATVIGVLLWRILSSGDPSSMKTLSANANLAEAYEKYGEELYMFGQEQRSITSGEDNYGYFSITDAVFIPQANQAQVVFRYNNSTLRHTVNDFAIEGELSRHDDVYDVTLLFAIDLTPDNDEDNFGNDAESVRFVRCHGETVASDIKNMYNYRQIVFDLDSAELDIKELLDSGLLLAVYADVYYNGALYYEQQPYGTLCLYDYKSVDMSVELERRDIKAIEKYRENAEQ